MDLMEVFKALKDGEKSLKDPSALKKDLRRAERDENEVLRRKIVPVAGLRSRRRILPITGLGTQGTGATLVNTTEIKYVVHLRTGTLIANNIKYIKLTQKKDGKSNDSDGKDNGKGENVDGQSSSDELGRDVTRRLSHQLTEFLVAENFRKKCVHLCHLHDTDLVLLTRRTKVNRENVYFDLGTSHTKSMAAGDEGP